MIIDSHMSFEQQINGVFFFFFFLKWIKDIRPYITEDLTKVLVHVLVVSRLDHCNALYIGLPKYLLNRLQSILNFAARVIIKCSGDEIISLVCQSLHWLPIEERILFEENVLVYKALHQAAPNYMSDMISPQIPQRTLRSSHSTRLLIPPYSKNQPEIRREGLLGGRAQGVEQTAWTYKKCIVPFQRSSENC